MVFVLSEDQPDAARTVNAQETHSITEMARLLGCRVIYIPRSSDEASIEDALAYAPEIDPPMPGIWVGYIPSFERYSTVYSVALAKGIRLLNTAEQHRTAMEFDQFYPLISDITPESSVVRSMGDVASVGERLGFPVFVKGAIKSNKDQGWSSCLAANEVELAELTRGLLSQPARSRGKVIVRRLVRLRHRQTGPDGFPLSREYRVFLYQENILAFGYYWDEYPDVWGVSSAERQNITVLAIKAAQRLGVPFIAVDIAQLDTDEWIVIEVADAQFAGLSQVSGLELWSKLADIT